MSRKDHDDELRAWTEKISDGIIYSAYFKRFLENWLEEKVIIVSFPFDKYKIDYHVLNKRRKLIIGVETEVRFKVLDENDQFIYGALGEEGGPNVPGRKKYDPETDWYCIFCTKGSSDDVRVAFPTFGLCPFSTILAKDENGNDKYPIKYKDNKHASDEDFREPPTELFDWFPTLADRQFLNPKWEPKPPSVLASLYKK